MKLLLLAGTAEAQKIAHALSEADVDAVASLAGATRAPKVTGLPTRIGGFGGDEGFRAYLQDKGITAVLDATHPFANAITTRTARITAEEKIPYAQVLRPQWTPEEGDNWTSLASEEAAAQHIAAGSTVFLATGRQTLDRFANLSNCRLICRQIDPPDRPFPFPSGEFLIGRPPFSVEEEVSLFRKLNVDWLIVKNAGGEAPRTKLVAARQLGIPVGMIDRPTPPDAKRVATVAEALNWVATL